RRSDSDCSIMLAVRHVLFGVALLLLCGIVPAVGAASGKMNKAKATLSDVKQYIDNIKESANEALTKAEGADRDAADALSLVTTAQSDADGLEKDVEPDVDHNKAGGVQEKAQKAMTTSVTAMKRLTEAAGSSQLAKNAAQAASGMVQMITEKVEEAIRLSEGSVPPQVKALLELVKTSQAGFADAASNAASSSSDATDAQESAKAAGEQAKQAAHEAGEIKKVGDQNKDGVNSVRNKEKVKEYAHAAAQHATKALDKAKAAENKAKTAFMNAKEAAKAFEQIPDAVNNAVTAADEVAKQKAKGGASSFASQGGSDLPLQQDRKDIEERPSVAVNQEKSEGDAPDFINDGHASRQHQGVSKDKKEVEVPNNTPVTAASQAPAGKNDNTLTLPPADAPNAADAQAPPAGDSEAVDVPNGLSSTEPTEATTTSDEHTGETSSPASGTPESSLLPSNSAVSAAMGESGGTDGSGS
ncbi:hypothetical protein DQ04_20631000, partial [Trypanosoma grayi]|uniref:hypothetical protein n=1 Tax=Trypanosoma grayi TaxID=71804 RepID=UPI0004F4A780